MVSIAVFLNVFTADVNFFIDKLVRYNRKKQKMFEKEIMQAVAK